MGCYLGAEAGVEAAEGEREEVHQLQDALPVAQVPVGHNLSILPTAGHAVAPEHGLVLAAAPGNLAEVSAHAHDGPENGRSPVGARLLGGEG
jgi:phosphotransferase system IIA component